MTVTMYLALILNLVVPSHGLSIGRWSTAIARARALVGVCGLLRRRAGIVVRCTVAHICLSRGCLGLLLLLTAAATCSVLRSAHSVVTDYNERHATITTLGIAEAFVVVVGFREFGNDVPCVEQARDLWWMEVESAAYKANGRGARVHSRSQGCRGGC